MNTNSVNIQFDIVRKGYNPDQVQDYISEVADAYSELYANYEKQQNRIAQLESENSTLSTSLQQQQQRSAYELERQQNRIAQLESENSKLFPSQQQRIEPERQQLDRRRNLPNPQESELQMQWRITQLEMEKEQLEQRQGRMYMREAERDRAEQQLLNRIAVLESERLKPARISTFEESYEKTSSESNGLLHKLEDITQAAMEMKRLVSGI